MILRGNAGLELSGMPATEVTIRGHQRQGHNSSERPLLRRGAATQHEKRSAISRSEVGVRLDLLAVYMSAGSENDV